MRPSPSAPCSGQRCEPPPGRQPAEAYPVDAVHEALERNPELRAAFDLCYRHGTDRRLGPQRWERSCAAERALLRRHVADPRLRRRLRRHLPMRLLIITRPVVVTALFADDRRLPPALPLPSPAAAALDGRGPFHYSPHALERLAERAIPRALVELARRRGYVLPHRAWAHRHWLVLDRDPLARHPLWVCYSTAPTVIRVERRIDGLWYPLTQPSRRRAPSWPTIARRKLR